MHFNLLRLCIALTLTTRPETETGATTLPRRQQLFRKSPGVLHVSESSEAWRCAGGDCSVGDCSRACVHRPHCVIYSHSPSLRACVLGGPVFQPLDTYDVSDPDWNTYKSECPLYAGWEFATYDSGEGAECLKIVNDASYNYDSALSACGAHGAGLLMVKDLHFYHFIKQVLEGVPPRLWVGATKDASDGQFYWSDRTLLTQTDPVWNTSGQHDKGCVVFRPSLDFRLWDVGCTWLSAFVCQFDL